MNPYTRRWHIWVCDDPSCHERHGEHQGEVHDVEVVPLSDAERMREALAEIAEQTYATQYPDSRAVPQTITFANGIHHIALAALEPK